MKGAPTRQTLEKMYWGEGKSQRQVAKELRCHRMMVRRAMARYNIPCRPPKGTRDFSLERQQLFEMYWENLMSQKEIAQKLGVSIPTIRYRLRKMEIPVRPAHITGQMRNPVEVLLGEVEKAYLAGMVDGDGWIGMHKITYWSTRYKHPTYMVGITVVNTNKDIIDWLHSIFGGQLKVRKAGRYKSNDKICYSWSVTSTKAANVLKALLPYLRLKKRQAELCLQSYEQSIEYWQLPEQRALSDLEVQSREATYQELKKLNKRGMK